MQQITIKECSSIILAEFERNQYSENTLRTKIIAFNCIDRWFLDHGTPYYDRDIALAFEEYVINKSIYLYTFCFHHLKESYCAYYTVSFFIFS